MSRIHADGIVFELELGVWTARTKDMPRRSFRSGVYTTFLVHPSGITRSVSSQLGLLTVFGAALTVHSSTKVLRYKKHEIQFTE
jgi:hypothetical protein